MFAAALPAYAALMPCGWDEDDSGKVEPDEECTLCHFWQLGSNIINFVAFRLAIAIAPLLFIVSGVILLTSEGNENRVAKARSIATNTAIGLIIIFCAWLLVDTAIKTIVDDTEGKMMWAWNKFPTCK